MDFAKDRAKIKISECGFKFDSDNCRRILQPESDRARILRRAKLSIICRPLYIFRGVRDSYAVESIFWRHNARENTQISRRNRTAPSLQAFRAETSW